MCFGATFGDLLDANSVAFMACGALWRIDEIPMAFLRLAEGDFRTRLFVGLSQLDPRPRTKVRHGTYRHCRPEAEVKP